MQWEGESRKEHYSATSNWTPQAEKGLLRLSLERVLLRGTVHRSEVYEWV